MDEVKVRIPKSLYEGLEKLIQGTGFESVEDFMVYVLRDVVSSGKLKEDVALTREEIEEVKRRLEALGYLK